MSEASGATTAVIETPAGTPVVMTVDNETGQVLTSETEGQPEPSQIPETIEAVADSAVEIAEIEANRDVAVAEIHAETEQAAIAAREGEQEWRTELTHLRTDLAALGEAIAATATVVEQLVSQSTLQSSLETEIIPIPEATEIITSETPTETSSVIVTEAPAKSVEEKLAEPTAKMARKVRMI